MRFSSGLKLAFLACFLVAGSVPRAWSQDKAADIPIKRVVMFSSGVAFFEHGGKVDGNASVDLKFNVKDINDLLKSMVLQDLDGGKISTVSYGSKDPITRTLATFSIDLTRNPTLGDLLQQIRGEKIEIDAPTKISGVILGVETRKIAGGKDQVVDTQFLNLLTDEGLRSVSLDNVGRIAIADKKLNDDLRQALLVLAAGKSSDKKAVSLSFLGQGQRNVRIGYIQESPIWKTSYRLVLEDDKAPFMQGWAIVENTTESDWNDVNLALVSGRPISFVMDLYQPLYVNRPVVEPELFASLRPRTYDQDLAAADGDFKRAAEHLEKAKGESFADRGMLRKAMAAPPAPASPTADAFAANGRFLAEGKGGGFGGGMNLQQGGQSVAQASDVGEMFRYEIAAPVKLGRGQSAMLPIVNESVQGEKVAIYNQGQHAKHPMSGLKLKNSTDLHLMQGPITVFDDGAYAGDAQIQDLPPASERLISYALDLDTEVAPTVKAEPQQLVSVRINRGVVFISHKYARAKSYLIKNSGRRVKKVLIEQAIEQPWQLIEPKEASEKTRDLYRFEVAAEPGKPATLEVKEEYSSGEQVAANNLNDGLIQYYLSAKVVSEEVKTALRELVRRKGQIAASAAKRQELDRQISVIDQEQTRIRNNMAQLPKDSDLFRRYVGKFTEQEDQIDALRQKVTAALDEEKGLQKSLSDYLNGLDLK